LGSDCQHFRASFRLIACAFREGFRGRFAALGRAIWDGYALSLPDCAPSFLADTVAIAAVRAYIHHVDMLNETREAQDFDEILADFELLDDWEDRYRYVIELGRKLEPLPDAERTAANKVQGCVSQVWLSTHIDRGGIAPRLSFIGDSDAHIVRGLIAILFALYSGKPADEIVKIDAAQKLGLLHLNEHLTPQRSNGLMAMVKRIRSDAEDSLGARTVH
jgi:cysteine desulfuration protein SufE